MLWIQNDKEVNIRQLFHNILSVKDIPHINTLDFPNKETTKFIERIGGCLYDRHLYFMGFTSSDAPS